MNEKKWKIGWGYTSACNMFCPFCYSKFKRIHVQEVDLALANRFLDINAEQISSINYGTGECCLSDNWFTFINRVRIEYPFISQALTTNGSIFHVIQKDAQKRKIFNRAIDEVDVSIDFANPEAHNRTRGHPNAFEWATQTLKISAGEGKINTLVFVGTEETLCRENLEGIFDISRKLGTFVRLNILRPTSPGLQPPSFEIVNSAIKWIIRCQLVVALADPLFGALFDPDHAEQESTGKTSLRILHNGSITPSTYLISEDWCSIYHIQEGKSLDEIASSDIFLSVASSPIPVQCRECPLVDICQGGAKDRRILHYGTFAECDPYCPMRHGFEFPEIGQLFHYHHGDKAPEAHNGYLPTLIFAPSSGIMA